MIFPQNLADRHPGFVYACEQCRRQRDDVYLQQERRFKIVLTIVSSILTAIVTAIVTFLITRGLN